MTLYASVEKMKDILNKAAPDNCGKRLGCGYIKGVNDALAAAPAQAKSEDEILTLCFEKVLCGDYGAMNPITCIGLTVRALRDAGCLYVKEVER